MDQSWAKPLVRQELEGLIQEFNNDSVMLKAKFSSFCFEHLLLLVAEERGKFTQSNPNFLKFMVNYLIELKVYPTEWNGKPINVHERVSGWGANWHEWSGILNCPHCNADLRNPNGPPFKREIGIYDRMTDRTVAYRCPDCSKEWKR